MALSVLENPHVPVLLEEVVSAFRRQENGTVIDATLGLGGHAVAILEACPELRLFGIDQDAEALRYAKRALRPYASRVKVVAANFAELKRLVSESNVRQVYGILADLGVSSLQFDSEARGFSFRFDAPLDMRMSVKDGVETAAELLARLSEAEIADIIFRFGEERASRRIARAIVRRRESGEPVRTTKQLAELVLRAVGQRGRTKIHPATRTFQALRIAVNRELESLENFIDDAVEILEPSGVIAVITFHSLEDRIVKKAFQRLSGRCSCPPRLPKCQCGARKLLSIKTRKPIEPTSQEIKANPRSRSAKLRIARRLNDPKTH